MAVRLVSINNEGTDAYELPPLVAATLPTVAEVTAAQAAADSAASAAAAATPLAGANSLSSIGAAIKTGPTIGGIIGLNPTTGRMWAVQQTTGDLGQSDDWGVTWNNVRGMPTGTTYITLWKAVTFGGNLYLATQQTGGMAGIYRAPDVAIGSPIVWEATPVFEVTNINHTFQVRSNFNAGSQYLFAGPYAKSGTGSDDSRIWRSADGTTWEEIHPTIAGIKHVHAVVEDPYNPGHIYAVFGDLATPFTVKRSTDHGTTWSILTTDESWLGVQVSFSERWVWFASDRVGSSVFVMDRDTGQFYDAAQNYHHNTAVPGGATGDRYYQNAYWGAVDPATGVWYQIAMDTSASGNKRGVFRMDRPGGVLNLIDDGAGLISATEVFIGNGYAWIGNFKYPLLSPTPIPA